MKNLKLISLYFFIFCSGISAVFAQGSLLLVGGGGENYNSWSDLPYSWFVQQADSGKIINIDVSSTSSWYPDYFDSFGAQGSEALQIANRTVADDQATYDKLISAKGIFIEGGDQWPYVQNWKGTKVEDAIHYVFENGGAIGGTSAGLAVLGEIVYDAKFSSLQPEDAAYDAYHPDLHLEDDFLKILPGVLTDSHFHSRGRLGRLVPMLARRIVENGESDITGIGVADKTALCIDPEGKATAYGHGSVTILYKTENSSVSVSAGEPVLFTDIGFDQLVHGASYDLNSKKLIYGGNYMTEYQPVNYSDNYIDTTFSGSDVSSASLGDIEIKRLATAELNAWNGNLRLQDGLNKIPGTAIIPQLWNDNAYYENRFIGGMWGAVMEPGLTVIYADDANAVTVNANGVIRSNKILYVLETWDADYAGVNDFEPTNYVGITGARLHFLTAGYSYDLKKNNVTNIEKNEIIKPEKFQLFGNYPNPFNSQTTISFSLAESGTIEIAIYDITGRQAGISTQEIFPAGLNKYIIDAGELSSGLYYYEVRFEKRLKDVGKMVLLK